MLNELITRLMPLGKVEEGTATDLRQKISGYGLDPEGKSVAQMKKMLAMAMWAEKHPEKPFPDQYAPMLAHDATKKSSEWMKKTIKSTDWWVQEKYDGIRSLLIIDNGKVRMQSRTPSQVTYLYGEHQDNFPHFRDMEIPFEGKVVLDGELISPVDEVDTGATVTGSKLQAVMAMVASKPEKSAKMQKEFGKAIYNTFDILYYNGEDVTGLPYEERDEIANKAVEAIKEANPEIPIEVAPTIKDFDNVKDIFKQHVDRGAEGVMLKKRSAPYSLGKRSRDLLKYKREVTVDGWISGSVPSKATARENLIGGFEISSNVDGVVQVIAAISGIDDKTREEATVVDNGKPALNPEFLDRCLEITGQEWTTHGKIKHARLVQWRPDKVPEDCSISLKDVK